MVRICSHCRLDRAAVVVDAVVGADRDAAQALGRVIVHDGRRGAGGKASVVAPLRREIVEVLQAGRAEGGLLLLFCHGPRPPRVMRCDSTRSSDARRHPRWQAARCNPGIRERGRAAGRER